MTFLSTFFQSQTVARSDADTKQGFLLSCGPLVCMYLGDTKSEHSALVFSMSELLRGTAAAEWGVAAGR